jgi:hypothetical protein
VAVVLPIVLLVVVVLGVAIYLKFKKKEISKKLSTKRDEFGLLVHWRLDRQLKTKERENNKVLFIIFFHFSFNNLNINF